MTINYLEKIVSGVADINGDAILEIGPSAPTEWWLPTYVRVSVSNAGLGRPMCTVYRGGPRVFDATTYVDDTLFAINDTSSIVAGQVVQYNERLSAVFSNASPGSVVLLAIYGRVSDLPPSQGEVLPDVPGTRFIAHASQENIELLTVIVDTDIDGSEQVYRGFVGDTPYLGFLAFATTNHFLFSIRFYSDAALTVPLATQDFSVRAGGTVHTTIPTLGSYVEIIARPSAVNSAYALRFYTARVPGIPFTEGDNFGIIGSTIANAILAGATEILSTTNVAPGMAHWYVTTDATVWFADLGSVSDLGVVRVIDRIDNLSADRTHLVFLPPTSMRISFTNSDGVARTWGASIVARPIEPAR